MNLPYSEQAVVMACGDEHLLGIVTAPQTPAQTPAQIGVVVVVGGAQYRAGSHRQFVLLARALARAGFAALRFDYRGMGDSEGQPRSFEAVDTDIAAAIDALQRTCPSVQKVVLWGLCDGASAALLYSARTDARVLGLCLLNPWVRSDATLARTHLKHYYWQRLFQGDLWRSLLNGKFAWRQAMQGLRHNWQARVAVAKAQGLDQGQVQPFQERMARALASFKGRVLLILSENDYTAKEFVECAGTDPQWSGLLSRPALTRVNVAGADHTFSSAQWRAEVEQVVVHWMAGLKDRV